MNITPEIERRARDLFDRESRSTTHGDGNGKRLTWDQCASREPYCLQAIQELGRYELLTPYEYTELKHRGQVDKAGFAYLNHLEDVRALVPESYKVAAYGHDLLEDTDATPAEMLAAGFAADDLDIIRTLTKNDTEPYETYLTRVRQHPTAYIVKLADITSNLTRLGAIADDAIRERLKQKYYSALVYLAR